MTSSEVATLAHRGDGDGARTADPLDGAIGSPNGTHRRQSKTGAAPLIVCSTIVRRFLTTINRQAAPAHMGVDQPGSLQLVRVDPADVLVTPTRFKIGDIESMVAMAVAGAKSGHNIYVEGRTLRGGTCAKGRRGQMADTVGCSLLSWTTMPIRAGAGA